VIITISLQIFEKKYTVLLQTLENKYRLTLTNIN